MVLTSAGMSAATALKSPAHAYGHAHGHASPHKHSSSRSSRPSTTPRSPPGPVSAGQPRTPILSPSARSGSSSSNNNTTNTNTSTSPNASYFGLVVSSKDSLPVDSAGCRHSRQNWIYPDYRPSPTSVTNSPGPTAPDTSTSYEAFRTQSEKGPDRFHLGSNLSSVSTPTHQHQHQQRQTKAQPGGFDIPRSRSPISMISKHHVSHHESARLSLPVNELKAVTARAIAATTAAATATLAHTTTTPTLAPIPGITRRSDTLPPSPKDHEPCLVGPHTVADLLRQPVHALILDLRVFHQCAAARIRGALNLCIPTTLLKRPSFTLRRLAETFSRPADRERFEGWRECDCIVVYDSSSAQAKEAVTCFNVLKKFTSEGWQKEAFVIKGGFQAFAHHAPDLVDSGPINDGAASPDRALSIAPPDRRALPVAGGCTMPANESAANPFFGNIRQNMDLIDGVGQMPIKKPRNLPERAERALPAWIRAASTPTDQGKTVSDRFLAIERQEQKRMHGALSTKVAYGSPTTTSMTPHSPSRVQVAGIEQGSKNRYNNIFPYDHCRVRLQGVARGDCDYINASYVKAEYCGRRYIAAQAPLPTTFDDFWRVVWEQQVRVIVMLTAESESGQVKSHAYWKTGEYGPLRARLVAERTVPLESRPPPSSPLSSTSLNRNLNSPSRSPMSGTTTSTRPGIGNRRVTSAGQPTSASASSPHHFQSPAPSPSLPSSFPPSVTVRTMRLTEATSGQTSEVVQLQYAQWPDFGAPTSPSVILALIGLVNRCVEQRTATPAVGGGDAPILVHCSAGCGRTGTFCTIDSVIEMLKRQRHHHRHHRPTGPDSEPEADRMEVDGEGEEGWMQRDDEDLIAKTVNDFRKQRLSMVQNLRQFVLCYETVLQWLANEVEKPQAQLMQRKSYHG